jgi:hypothetical protein
MRHQKNICCGCESADSRYGELAANCLEVSVHVSSYSATYGSLTALENIIQLTQNILHLSNPSEPMMPKPRDRLSPRAAGSINAHLNVFKELFVRSCNQSQVSHCDKEKERRAVNLGSTRGHWADIVIIPTKTHPVNVGVGCDPSAIALISWSRPNFGLIDSLLIFYCLTTCA